MEIIVKALSLKNLSPFYIILEDAPLFTDLFVGTMHDIRRCQHVLITALTMAVLVIQ